MLVPTLAAILSIVQPVPISSSFRVLPDDYPAHALRLFARGCAIAKLTIDASGIPIDCIVTGSTANGELDVATCRVLMRTRFLPARDADGAAVAVTMTRRVNWGINGVRKACPPLVPDAVPISSTLPQ